MKKTGVRDRRSSPGRAVHARSDGVQNRIVVAFDDFQEQSRPILHVLREQLQQVAVVVEVDKNTQLLKLETHHIIGNRLDAC